MDIIEFDRWKPSADDPRKLEYAGQRPAREVFEELKHRLDGVEASELDRLHDELEAHKQAEEAMGPVM